jgi:hypothetical protein
MLRFYMDQHVHGGITAGLRRIGIDCLTAAEDGSNELGDASLLARATELERVVFSNDLDMPLLAEQWMLQLRTFAGVTGFPPRGSCIPIPANAFMRHTQGKSRMR